jgi:predicted nucleic-acid-binding protein
VLLRLIVDDHPEQVRKAVELVREAQRRRERLYVSDVVLCETAWVLTSVYRLPRVELASRLEQLLGAAELAFRDREALEDALGSFAEGKGDFADFVIRAQARATGCDAVATFDTALHGQPGFLPA